MAKTKYEEDRELEELLKGKFNRMWHTYRQFHHKDKDNATCYWCQEPATERVMVNIWGVVHDVPGCQAHFKQHDGVMRDDL